MRYPAILPALAGGLFGAQRIARLTGWVEHTSAIVGMPRSNASGMLGPLFVALYLVVVVVAPILAIAGTVETCLRVRRVARKP